MHTCTRMQGHSLIETLFVLFLVAVLCGFAVSALHEAQTKLQVQAGAQALLNAVLSARAEAVRREKRVSICVAAPTIKLAGMDTQALPLSCATSTELGQGAAWQNGWLMFEDDNNNGMWESGEAVLLRHAHLGLKVSATGNTTVRQNVSFGASGRSLTPNGAFQAGTLTICEHQALTGKGWLLVINAVGRPRLELAEIAKCA
jgi:type IV fimbrial biogenesis protein FimT